MVIQDFQIATVIGVSAACLYSFGACVYRAYWSTGYDRLYEIGLATMSLEMSIFFPFIALAPGTPMTEIARMAGTATIVTILVVAGVENRHLIRRW